MANGFYEDCKAAPKLAIRVTNELWIYTTNGFFPSVLVLMDMSSLPCNLEFFITSQVWILYWNCQL